MNLLDILVSKDDDPSQSETQRRKTTDALSSCFERFHSGRMSKALCLLESITDFCGLK